MKRTEMWYNREKSIIKPPFCNDCSIICLIENTLLSIEQAAQIIVITKCFNYQINFSLKNSHLLLIDKSKVVFHGDRLFQKNLYTAHPHPQFPTLRISTF